MHSISTSHFSGTWKMGVWMLGWEILALTKYCHADKYTESNDNIRAAMLILLTDFYKYK